MMRMETEREKKCEAFRAMRIVDKASESAELDLHVRALKDIYSLGDGVKK